ncbi:hypothetical protein [Paralysiella testudinis]|uniref:Uncharacterized protein n=1 Tax=Paralysiella testudinis TaxID=2809020 RepID=A0A892ZJS0_9NEIS|nr:hypothetical protein [Paralysiella testudinis]QRQ81794.1 hypothetical protein JQU52_14180 [Paralysiella testudinis]
MNTLKQLAHSAKTKYAATGITIAAAATAANAANSWDGAVEALTGLLVGVAAVGAASLAIAVAAVGFRIVKNLVYRS